MTSSTKTPIYVTRPTLPPLADFIPCLEDIWQSGQLTNGGPFHEKLEAALCEHLGVPFISLFNNGTQALITALQALDLAGEVITTPYSFVATSHALMWNRLAPVFADIEADGFNLDPEAVEAAITPRTSAILAVHCYGFPCQTERLQQIADKHGLKLVYDAAHAFGVEDAGGSILRHGDLSVLSFHATKVFNTLEGGAIVSHTAEMKARIDRLKNFGFASETQIDEIGTNGKMNEVQAALGLLQLKQVDTAIQQRRQRDATYCEALQHVTGLTLPQSTAKQHNYSYFPVIVTPDYPLSRDQLHLRLQQNGIFTRRYFHPLISDMPPYQAQATGRHLPNAIKQTRQILCLPLHSGLSQAEQAHVIDQITNIE
jgi:dTDP-4-amino-4,6-dideoxygalactose transaminase